MGSKNNGIQLIQFIVEYYQCGDVVYSKKDEDIFSPDGYVAGFIDNIKFYEEALEQDTTYPKEGELCVLDQDEKWIVKSPFYVVYPMRYMGDLNEYNCHTMAEFEIDAMSLWDFFNEEDVLNVINLAKPDIDAMIPKPVKEDESNVADTEWYNELIEIENSRSRKDPIFCNIITVWEWRVISYYSYEGEYEYDYEHSLVGKLNLTEIAKNLKS